jgi:anti-sigma factor RsiW
MNCNEAREHLLDLAQADAAAVSGSGEVEQHLATCTACAQELESMRATMSLLDEWQAPEISPYFDQRLRARVREVAAESSFGWLNWLRKPALAVAFALLMVLGISLYRSAPIPGVTKSPDNIAMTTQQRGTAVSDLKDLDQNEDLYANFDTLDDLADNQEQAP